MQDICAALPLILYDNKSIDTFSYDNIIEVALEVNQHYNNMMFLLFKGMFRLLNSSIDVGKPFQGVKLM